MTPSLPSSSMYVLSSSVASTCTLPRGSAVKLYHSSLRTQAAGRPCVEGWFGSSIWTVAFWNWLAPAGWLRNCAPPFMSVIHCQSRSALVCEWMPTRPLPRWNQRSKALRWTGLSTPSPSVLSRTTTSYGRRPASVNSVASSLWTTL